MKQTRVAARKGKDSSTKSEKIRINHKIVLVSAAITFFTREVKEVSLMRDDMRATNTYSSLKKNEDTDILIWKLKFY